MQGRKQNQNQQYGNALNPNPNQNQQYRDPMMPLDTSINSTGYGGNPDDSNPDAMDISDNTLNNTNTSKILRKNRQQNGQYPYINQLGKFNEQTKSLMDIQQNMRNGVPVDTTQKQQGPIFGDDSKYSNDMDVSNDSFRNKIPKDYVNVKVEMDNSLTRVAPGTQNTQGNAHQNNNNNSSTGGTQGNPYADYFTRYEGVTDKDLQNLKGPRRSQRNLGNRHDYKWLAKIGTGSTLPGQQSRNHDKKLQQ